MNLITNFTSYYEHGTMFLAFGAFYALLVLTLLGLSIYQLVTQKKCNFLIGVAILVLQPMLFIWGFGVGPLPKMVSYDTNATLLEKWTVENAPASIPTQCRLLALYKINNQEILGFISPEDFGKETGSEVKITVKTDINGKILPYQNFGLEATLSKNGKYPMLIGS